MYHGSWRLEKEQYKVIHQDGTPLISDEIASFNSSLEELKQNIQRRDELQEKAGYYKIYDKTIVVDVSECENVQASAKKVLSFIKKEI